MRLFRFLFLIMLALLLIFYACKKEEDFDPQVRTDVFTRVWNDFDRTYPYFIHKNVNWDSVYDVFSPRINDSISQKELSNIIGEMTLVVRDIHVNFNSSYGSFHYSKKQNYPENPPDNAQNYLADEFYSNSRGHIALIENTNYAYLRIHTFTGSEEDFRKLAVHLNHIKELDGLIIDIRSNGGGNETNGRVIAGRFISSDQPYKYTRTRNGSEWDNFTSWTTSTLPSISYLGYHKPVILLSNRSVYSSSELFVLMMKTYPDLIIVGDTTGAASANPVSRTLPYGWNYRVSSWQSATLDYVLIEDNGIPPDYYVLMTEASIAEGRDLILEKAIEVLNGK